MRRLWPLFAALLVLAVGVAVPATGAAKSSPSTPGAVRVIHNGEWVYFNELAEGTGFVEVSAEPGALVLHKTPRGYKIDVTWGWNTHTYVDVQYVQIERPATTVRR